MLSLPAAIKVYLCTVPCDMRHSFDGLSMMAEHVIGCNPFPGHLLVFCNRRSDRVKILYWDREGRLALCQAKSGPILDDIKAYLRREQPKVLPKSPEGQAIADALTNWEALVRYSEDGDLEIDNNGAERSLRGVAVGSI